MSDEYWATIVAAVRMNAYPKMEFSALERIALGTVQGMRAGRKYPPGGVIGELMQESFEALAREGLMEPFVKEDDVGKEERSEGGG